MMVLLQKSLLKINENKEILGLINKLQESRHILLKNFDVFKSYINEKMIIPLKSEENLQNEIMTQIKVAIFESLIENKKFYEELIAKFPHKS